MLSSSLTTTRAFIMRHRHWLPYIALALALIYPFIVRIYYLSLAVEILIYAIFAMSLDLLLGYTGLTSFGHAAFFGVGAYILAYVSSRSDKALQLTSNLLVTLPIVVGGAALAAAVIGFFAIRTRGIYFLMVTLAFAQMLFSIAISWSSVTGGSDGLTGVPNPSIGIGPLSYALDSRASFYYLVLSVFIVMWWLLRRIVASPFGWTLRGIRENEARMSALGYHTFRYKWSAFIIAGAVAGVAGALQAHNLNGAPPDSLYWSTSGQVMIMLIVGGTGTLSGPILGAGIIRLLNNFVSSYTERWELVVGLVLILFVMFAPRGVAGWLRGNEGDKGN
jgi:branched-chain amino acid transport system permease protein